MSVDIARSLARVTADWKLMSALPVLMSPARVLLPAPFCVKAPPDVMSPAGAVVNVPALVMVVVPPTWAAALTVRSLPEKARLPVRLTAPPRVVAPLPACCVRLAAFTAARLTFWAETTFTALSAAVSPTAPDTDTLPVPAVMVRLRAVASLLMVELKLTSPEPEPVFKVVSLERIAAPVTAMLPPAAWVAPAPPPEVLAVPAMVTALLAVSDTSPPAPVP